MKYFNKQIEYLKKISFHDIKIRTRLVLSISIFSIFGISIILLIVGLISSRSAEKNAGEVAHETALTYKNIIKSIIEEPLYEARLLAYFIESSKNKLVKSTTREDINDLLKTFVEKSKYGIAYYVRFEPNAFDGLDAQYANTAGYSVTGRFSSYWMKDIDGKSKRKFLPDYQTVSIDDPHQIPNRKINEYYELPKKMLNECILEPYANPIFGKDKPLISVIVPILDANLHFLGIAGVDVPLERLQIIIENFKVGHFKNAYVTFYSHGGVVVGSKYPSSLGKNIYNITGDKELINMVLVNEDFFIKKKSDITLKKEFIYGSALEIGKTETLWTVTVNISEEEVFAEVNRLAGLILTIGLLSTFLIICGIWIMSGAITTPIDKMSKVFQIVAGGNFDFDEPIDLTRKDEIGSLAKSFILMRDEIRKQIFKLTDSEKALSESEQKYRSLYHEYKGIIEAIPDVLTLLSPDMKIIWTNTEGKDVNIPTHIGKFCYQVRHMRQEICDRCPAINSIETRRLSSIETITPDGKIWELRVIPIFDDNGQIKGFIESSRNITKRRKAEEALKESEYRLRSIGDNLPGGMIYQLLVKTDGEKKFTYVSAGVEKLHGHTPQHVLTDPSLLYNDVHKEDISRMLKNEKESFDKLKTFDVEVRLVGDSGEIRWHHIVSQPRLLPNGDIVADGIELDITEQKVAELELQKIHRELEQRVLERTEQLEAANKELESFSYSVSHDLRAPLRAIDGYARMVEEDYRDKLDDEGRRFLGVVRSEAIRMGQLIDDLLRFSRLGRQTLIRISIDMTGLVREVYTQLQHENDNLSADLRIADLPQIKAEPSLMRQVWNNLLQNAVKFSRRRKDILIVVGSYINHGEAVYFVKDNGVGFDMRYADKLFGVFQRLHNQNEFEGTGVGLALVQRIIHRHGGHVWAESELDKGATFFFSLPLKAGDE